MHAIQNVPVSGCDHLPTEDLAAISTESRIPAGIFSKEINFRKSLIIQQAIDEHLHHQEKLKPSPSREINTLTIKKDKYRKRTQ